MVVDEECNKDRMEEHVDKIKVLHDKILQLERPQRTKISDIKQIHLIIRAIKKPVTKRDQSLKRDSIQLL